MAASQSITRTDRPDTSVPLVIDGVVRCGALTSSSGYTKRCVLRPVTGRPRCATHGGKTPKGPAHYNYQGKGKSKYDAVPQHLRERFETVVNDPQYIVLKEDIALLDAHIVEMLDLLDMPAAHEQIQLAQGALLTIEQQCRREEPDLHIIREAADTCLSHLATVLYQHDTMDRIADYQERKRKLVDTELKTVATAQKYIPIVSIQSMLHQLADIAHHTTDNKTRTLITELVVRTLDGR